MIPAAPVADDEHATFREIALDAIEPNPYQPRTEFDTRSIAELAASIGELGLLQPVLVRPIGDHFELIAGERRWRAAQLAGLTTIPALVRPVADDGALEQAIVENVHREDLTAIEEATAYRQLADDFGLSAEHIAQRVGRSRPAVANTLRLLQLPPSVQRLVLDRELGAGHARAILGLEDPVQQERLARRAVAESLSVRQVEGVVKRQLSGILTDEADNPPPGSTRDPRVIEVENLWAELLATKVRVEIPSSGRGRVVIEVADIDDLMRVFGIVSGATQD